MWEVTSIIIPAYNEEERLDETLQILTQTYAPFEIIGVNDGSIDSTGEILEKYCTRVSHLPVNRGKAAALREGFQQAKGEILLCLDADLGRSVQEANKLLTPLENDSIDGVIGVLPSAKRGGFGLVKKRAQNLIFQATGEWFSAPLSGQRSIRRKWLPVLLNNNYCGYGIETAMTIDLMKKGAILVESDVVMYHREMGRSIKGFLHRGKQWYDMEKTIRSVLK